MFDFGALPPEVNSGLMYTGAGSAPMMAAAQAWNSLAAELDSAASAYQTLITTLAGDEWRGPASASMAAAATPYIGWMSNTAAAVQHAANQAMASASAYETAFAMTVPPEVVAANRALLANLIATNFLGQNTPAIAAAEAHYAEMWTQDAAAMYGYAGTSQAAGQLQPLTSPAQTTNASGIAAQAAAVSGAGTGGLQTELSQLISGLHNAVGSLSSPLASTSGASGLAGMADSINSFLAIPLVADTINNTFYSAGWWVPMAIPTSVMLAKTLATFAAATGGAASLGAGMTGGTVLASSVGSTGVTGAGALVGAPVAAGMGGTASVGGLSVPAAWSAATPAVSESATATLAGSGWTAAAEEGTQVAAVPAGMGPMAAGGRGGFGFGAPRYGFKPTVMPKQVLV